MCTFRHIMTIEKNTYSEGVGVQANILGAGMRESSSSLFSCLLLLYQCCAD